MQKHTKIRHISRHAILQTPVIDFLKFALTLGCIGWLFYRGSIGLGYNWQWYRVPAYLFRFAEGHIVWGPLIDGLRVTLKITTFSLVSAFVIGLVTALLRLSGSITANLLSRGYLELIRNTPLLVQLFFIYFVLAPVFNISGFTSAVLSLSLFEGAYASEIFRAGILSIHQGQWEAAYSLGLNTRFTYQLVVLPQAIRRILPPLTSQAVSLIKDSALVSTIAIYDLTMQGQIIIARTYMVFELWFTIAALYLVVTSLLSLAVRQLEIKMAVAD